MYEFRSKKHRKAGMNTYENTFVEETAAAGGKLRYKNINKEYYFRYTEDITLLGVG